MKKGIGVCFLFVFLLLFVVAVEVTVVGEPRSFSGGVLRLRASGSSGDYGDKIYPSENYGDVGVLKFDVESFLSEGEVFVVLVKGGVVVKEVWDEFETILGKA